jgi:hypothetical protein
MGSESIRQAFFLFFAGRMVPAAVLAILSCNFYDDVTRPFEYTTVTYRGMVRDADFGAPIESVSVALDESGPIARTDINGEFCLTGVRTGPHRLGLTNINYETADTTIDLVLDPKPDTISLTRKNAVPKIVRFDASPLPMLSREDTVNFFIEAWDSTGGIDGVAIESDTARSHGKQWLNPQLMIKDSFICTYRTPGSRMVRLSVTGARGDISMDSVLLSVPANQRPRFSLIRLAPDGFINGEWGFLEIYAEDPDSNFSYLTIAWGDTSKTEKSYDIAGAHWHKYQFKSDTTVTVGISVFDSLGAKRDTALTVQVRNSSAPKLDDRIIFDPSQYLSPLDTSVVIGVRILEIDSMYVPEIVWLINQNDPASAFSARKTYTPQTGKIGDIGNVFAQAFSTDKFKATNIVQIIVKDRLGKTSTVTGSIYKVGGQ